MTFMATDWETDEYSLLQRVHDKAKTTSHHNAAGVHRVSFTSSSNLSSFLAPPSEKQRI